MNEAPPLFSEVVSSVGRSGDLPPQLLELSGGQVAVCSLACPESGTANEDCVAVVTSPLGHTLLIVADGVGGSRQGHVASRTAVQCVVQAVLGTTSDTTRLRPVVIDAIEHADHQVRELGTGAATTLAIAEIFENQLRTYHCGDSTILVCTSHGRVRVMTVGHNPTDMAVDAGWMEPAQALSHHERHLVSNILGSRPLRIEIGPRIPLAPRDTVLVASDGLFDNLVPGRIVESIRKGPFLSGFQRLIGETRTLMDSGEAVGKPDDLSVLAWRRGKAAN